MKLSLDHVQRLNLVALLDVTEASGRREAHAICKLQDLIDLNAQEREAINLEQVNVGGQGQAYRWDPAKTLPAFEYDLAQPDIERICKALDMARIMLGRDRWFRALNAQLPEPDVGPGDPAIAAANAGPGDPLAANAARHLGNGLPVPPQ